MNILSHISGPQMPALMAVAIGFIIRFLVARRRFNRRNQNCIQQFNNYFTGLITNLLERCLSLIAGILIIGGLLLFLAES